NLPRRNSFRERLNEKKLRTDTRNCNSAAFGSAPKREPHPRPVRRRGLGNPHAQDLGSLEGSARERHGTRQRVCTVRASRKAIRTPVPGKPAALLLTGHHAQAVRRQPLRRSRLLPPTPLAL